VLSPGNCPPSGFGTPELGELDEWLIGVGVQELNWKPCSPGLFDITVSTTDPLRFQRPLAAYVFGPRLPARVQVAASAGTGFVRISNTAATPRSAWKFNAGALTLGADENWFVYIVRRIEQ
jgi:hypothetical protein